MRRRDFVLAFGGAAAAGWPGIASAQHTAKSPIIGFMGAGTPEGWKDWTSAFQQRMRELGWVEGRNLWMEYGWAEGNADRYAEIANEFAKLKVDIIVTVGGDAAKRATSTIPIVVAMMPDPVGTGLVTSLARPGGNLTGLSIRANDLAGKRLELLREVIPDLRRFTILASRGYSANLLELNEVLTGAKSLGLEALIVEVGRSDEIAPAIAAFKDRSEALYVPANPFAESDPDQRTGAGRAIADRAWLQAIRGGRRADVLRAEHTGPVSARRRLRRPDTARRQAGRPADRTANQIRFDHQFEDSPGARPRGAADGAGSS
jgi:putative ABC transport system substrate-binding protein